MYINLYVMAVLSDCEKIKIGLKLCLSSFDNKKAPRPEYILQETSNGASENYL